MDIRENIPLAPLTTFKVGGNARYLVEARSADDVLATVEYARSNHLPLFILGGGSNLVVADAGWPGLVLKIAIGGVSERDNADKKEFEVGAGEDWDKFVALTVARNCAGVETLSGIPGTVGGTPVQNVGAYGQEVAETITSVRVLELATMQVRDLGNSECGFAYRTSIFNSSERGRYIVLRVTFALTLGGTARIAYADLKKYFPEGSSPSLQQVRDAVREIRLSKAMLIVPNDDDCRSAGSFFKNPIVDAAKYEEVAARVNGNAPPKYPAGDGKVKLSAAWLVEQSGFQKGLSRGPVGISRRHSLAIVNRGGATAADILALKNEVQAGVRDKFGIELTPEPVFVGFE
ncbi:MAG: UDP-N-acetylenolpyruvoylglucosamine reductase [Acidobacteriaceae bacterium]|nr:UDP-N-acetylenolpyruvoylglucosamine reductase [Acidobacteriaceae bacterium]